MSDVAGESESFEDAMLFSLKMEEGAMSQGMQLYLGNFFFSGRLSCCLACISQPSFREAVVIITA